MARKSLLKRAVSSFTALAIATVAMPVIPAFAEAGTVSYSFDGYDVEYSVKNEWTDGQSIEVKITNTGDEPILNWAFKYDAEGEINGLWNASVYDSQETSYIIKNVGWNYEIAPDASVSFGYTLSDYSGTNPDKFELCAKRVDKTDGYDVQYNITNEWDIGLQGEIVITNTSEEPLEAWELSFDSTFAINNLWNGKIISSEDNHYVVASEMWSNPIAVGESRTIGFTGIKNSESELSVDNYALSVVIIDTNGNNGGNDNPEPDIDLTTDTDGDKVPDAYEEVYGTDPENPDTDGDGLTDYEEIALTNSNPLVYNSIDESLSDEDADYDKDGFSTREELTLGTDPTQADTDNDRINDYDEVNVWHTNPLVADTDNDGIADGDEVKIGLDPANPETFGYPDIEFKSTQHISEDSISLSSINNEDNNIFTYSVDVTSNGYVEPYMYARESCYTSVMKNDFMIGVAPELVYLGKYDIDNIKVSFSISDEYIEKTKSPEESKEDFLNRITIFRYFESANALLPVSTSIDEKTGALYTESNAVTTYCLMDRDAWINMLEEYAEKTEDAEITVKTELSRKNNKKANLMTVDEVDEEPLLSISPVTDEDNLDGDEEDLASFYFTSFAMTPLAAGAASAISTKPTSSKYIDVIFILQSAGTSKSYFDQEKETIRKVSESLFNYSSNVRICVINYKYRSSGLKVIWNDKYEDVKTSLDSISYVSESGYCNRGAAFAAIKYSDFRANASKFIMHFVNGATTSTGFYDHTSFCNDNNINLSEFKPYGYHYIYESDEKRVSAAITGTGGLYEVYYSSNWNKYYQHIINNSAEPEKEYRGLVPTCWKVITLEAPLVPNSNTDTDRDSISDWNEVKNSLLQWDSAGKVKQISLAEFYNEYCNVGLNDVINYEENEKEILQFLEHVTVLPLESDPTDPDGDADGIHDSEDKHPLVPFRIACADKIIEMEKLIDNYYNEDYVRMLIRDGTVAKNHSSIVTMNIIRSVKYGTQFGGLDADLDKFKWFMTSGENFDSIRLYIENRNPYIMSYFRDKNMMDMIEDPFGNEIDFIHMMATLSGQYNQNVIGNIFIPKQLSGWAGDLQSLIYDLKIATYGTGKNLKEVAANELIAQEDTYFDLKDMVSDIDAENISNEYAVSINLSQMLLDYYKDSVNNRYNIFLNNYGDIKSLEIIANEFTKGNLVVKHHILHSHADKAAKQLQAVYKNSLIGYEKQISYITTFGVFYEDVPVYSLPSPEIVTDAESEALTYAFITFISRQQK